MKKFWNLEKLIGIVAFVISLGTLFTFIYQTRLMREHQRASVLPYLEINYLTWPDNFVLQVENNGIGPAFVKDVRIKYKDSIYHLDPADFLIDKLLPSDTVEPFILSQYSISKGMLIPAGKTVKMLSAKGKEGCVYLTKIFAKKAAVTEITYSSIYQETWITKGFNPPVQIED
ncbi:MAG: hypothetical protein ACEPOZ_08535 [Marinifilaceae bacterium]